jgi:hypothetical protein
MILARAPVLRIARVDLDYPAGNIASLGIPANMIADFEVFAHTGPQTIDWRADQTNLIITWDWPVLRCRVVSQVEEDFIHVAPAPAFWRIITFNDQVTGCMIMTGRMTTWRLIATTNVPASPADSEMNPFAAGLQTFLAAASTWSNIPDGAQMRAAFTHDRCHRFWYE